MGKRRLHELEVHGHLRHFFLLKFKCYIFDFSMVAFSTHANVSHRASGSKNHRGEPFKLANVIHATEADSESTVKSIHFVCFPHK